MLVLDDSGSMQWSYLGDSVKPNGYVNAVGYRSALCNKLYYNPSNTYLPPVAADGAPVAAASFGAAWLDGYRRADSDARVDLGTQFRAWRSRLSDRVIGRRLRNQGGRIACRATGQQHEREVVAADDGARRRHIAHFRRDRRGMQREVLRARVSCLDRAGAIA